MPDPLQSFLQRSKQRVERRYADTSYTDCYIAFLDVLGMKNLVQEQQYEDMRKLFNVVEIAKEVYGRIGVEGGQKFLEESQIRATAMSDSVVLSINADTDQALSKIIGFSSYLIQGFLTALNQPVFIRGGIVRGGVFHQGETVFGPGLIDAYYLEEKEAINMRCIISKSLYQEQAFKDYINLSSNGLKQDIGGYFFINFLRDENKKRLAEHCSLMLGSDINEAVKNKYKWLKNYIDGE